MRVRPERLEVQGQTRSEQHNLRRMGPWSLGRSSVRIIKAFGRLPEFREVAVYQVALSCEP